MYVYKENEYTENSSNISVVPETIIDFKLSWFWVKLDLSFTLS